MHVENPLKHSTCRQLQQRLRDEEMHFRFEGGATLRQQKHLPPALDTPLTTSAPLLRPSKFDSP